MSEIIEESDIDFEDADVYDENDGVLDDSLDIDLDENIADEEIPSDHGKGYKRRKL